MAQSLRVATFYDLPGIPPLFAPHIPFHQFVCTRNTRFRAVTARERAPSHVACILDHATDPRDLCGPNQTQPRQQRQSGNLSRHYRLYRRKTRQAIPISRSGSRQKHRNTGQRQRLSKREFGKARHHSRHARSQIQPTSPVPHEKTSRQPQIPKSPATIQP